MIRALVLLLLFLTAPARAQMLSETTFAQFVAQAVPATSCTSSDLLVVIQGGQPKNLPCSISSLGPASSGPVSTILMQAGFGTGMFIGNDFSLGEDGSHNLSIGTGPGIAGIFLGNQVAPITIQGVIRLVGLTTITGNTTIAGNATITGTLTSTGAGSFSGGLTVTALPPGNAGRCLGYKPATGQIYVSLRSDC